MDGVVTFLSAVAKFIFDQFGQTWALYTGGGVLGFTLILWILDRLFHIFDVIKR